MTNENLQGNSHSWLFFVKCSFVLSLAALVLGIVLVPAELVVKGYLAVTGMFLVSSTITLSKTLRDEHENQRLLNKLSEARTKQLIQEFGE